MSFLLAPWFLMSNQRNSVRIIILLQIMHHFSLATLNFSVFNIQQFNYDLGVACFEFTWFEVHWICWICRFLTSTKFGKFSDNFFLASNSPFLLVPWWYEYLSFCYCLTDPWDLFSFFNLFFSLLFWLDHFYWSIFMFWLTSIISTLLLSPSSEVLFLVWG